MSQVVTMNVVDMRQRYRRAPVPQSSGGHFERRKGTDRRVNQVANAMTGNFRRIWLTPGERNLIEDLYLLNGEDK